MHHLAGFQYVHLVRNRLVGHVLRGQQRNLVFEAKAVPLLQQAGRIGAGLYGKHHVGLQGLDLAEIRAKVGRTQRVPKLARYRATWLYTFSINACLVGK